MLRSCRAGRIAGTLRPGPRTACHELFWSSPAKLHTMTYTNEWTKIAQMNESYTRQTEVTHDERKLHTTTDTNECNALLQGGRKSQNQIDQNCAPSPSSVRILACKVDLEPGLQRRTQYETWTHRSSSATSCCYHLVWLQLAENYCTHGLRLLFGN